MPIPQVSASPKVQIVHPGEGQFAKALIFGPQGRGKTHFLGTAQLDKRTSPMLFIDFEGGSRTLDGLDIDMVKIRSWSDYDEVYAMLAAGTKYKSIGWDSISETHVFALLDILDNEGATRKDPDLLQQGDYGKASVQMRRLIRRIRDLPYHVFMSALSQDSTDPREGTVTVPALSGKLADEIPAMLDVVGYLAAGQDEQGSVTRVMILQNYPKIRTKIRSPWGSTVPDEIEDPTVTKLLDVLKIK